ncbi:uncharacterized protein LOC115882749 isoform X3 [Sitophilus oryzae]|uniref:Uncharacterized protein LOC115882749 isoform X3 n=1 Tax=Sitophilus oryzae TaxID=7048 RepID=A0A6J2XZF4_SITOR|nr:uncharacterized protein LOC115882749 isoform X3 [Sitophilus oryzae]
MSALLCAALGCINTSKSCSLSFFRFPSDENRATIWLKACRREDLLHKADNIHNLSYRLCGQHFASSTFANCACSRLRKNVNPSIFPSLGNFPQYRLPGDSGPPAGTEHEENGKCVDVAVQTDQIRNTVFEISDTSNSDGNFKNALVCEENINEIVEDEEMPEIKIEPIFLTDEFSDVLSETSNIAMKLEIDPVASSDEQSSTSNRDLGDVSRSITQLPVPPLIMIPKPDAQTTTDNLQSQKCCLPYCNSNSSIGPKVDMFPFPKDPALKKKWLDNLFDKPLEVNSSSKVCLLHFGAPDVEWVTKHLISRSTGKLLSTSTETRLVQDAVPFKFTRNQTQRSEAIPENTEPVPQPLEMSVNNEVSKEPQTNEAMEVEDKAYFKNLDEAFEKLKRTKLDSCWFKIREPRYIYFFYLDPQPNPTLMFAVHLSEDLTLSLKQDNRSVDEIKCRNKVTISFPVKVLDLQALSVILKEIEFYLKYRAQYTINAKKKSSVPTKLRSRLVTAAGNVCKLCLDDVDAYIRCVKCLNEFHPGCLAAQGLDDCDKCKRTFNRLSERRNISSGQGDKNETAFNDNQYLIRIVKEEEEKNNILEKNCNMLEERINRLTASLAK